MKRFWRWLKRGLWAGLIVLVGLALPVARNEALCRGDAQGVTYLPLLPPEHRRAEGRTLMTYPEWHIVHANDDYAQVIATGDPHAFGYLRAIGSFWSSLCALSTQVSAHGGFDGETKATIYTIGVSFTAEMLAKAAYEETLGRLAAGLRGEARSALDDLSERQARGYADFLQQVPWYRWDFRADRAALGVAAQGGLRDTERRLALGAEYGVKAVYADAIAAAVASTGYDELTLRMIVRAPDGALAGLDGVTVIARRPEGTEVETPRYRALTQLMAEMATRGVEFVEIAGNDDILLTALGDRADRGALFAFDRQGYGDTRHLLLVRVPELAGVLRGLPGRGLRLEHIHDY